MSLRIGSLMSPRYHSYEKSRLNCAIFLKHGNLAEKMEGTVGKDDQQQSNFPGEFFISLLLVCVNVTAKVTIFITTAAIFKRTVACSQTQSCRIGVLKDFFFNSIQFLF